MALSKNFGLVDLRLVSTLHFDLQTLEVLLQGVLGTSVQHLALGGSSVRGPEEEDDFASETVSLVVFEVVDGVSAVVVRELLQELVVRGGGLTLLFNLDLLGVFNLEDDVAVSVSQLEGVELIDAIVVDGNTGVGHYNKV